MVKAAIVHNFVWQASSSQFPGRWFFFAKSNMMERQPSGAYWFADDATALEPPAGSGYVAWEGARATHVS